MKVLAVETATSWQSVALLDDERVLAREDQEATGAHGTLLLPTITRLLANAGLTLKQLDGLVCSIGPGSFTGLRVGTATLLGLRAATDLPLVLVPTLEAMAWSLRGTSGPICPVLPSRKDEIYWAVFRWGPMVLLSVSFPSTSVLRRPWHRHSQVGLPSSGRGGR